MARSRNTVCKKSYDVLLKLKASITYVGKDSNIGACREFRVTHKGATDGDQDNTDPLDFYTDQDEAQTKCL